MKLYGTPPTRALRVLWLLRELDIECEIVTVDMGIPTLDRAKIPMTGDGDAQHETVHGFDAAAVSMGNPHIVLFVPKLERVPFETAGPAIEGDITLFPLRTNVYGALGPNDLANSMVSPYEMTAPKLLARRGYQSALFGKFHLGLQGNNPAGIAMVSALGWNYFAGYLDETGDPSSIDTSAGGVAPPGTWSCGFVTGASSENRPRSRA